MDQAAEDDKERARNRARLYAPPKGARNRGQARAGTAMNRGQAQALMAQMAAEDAQLGRRTGR
ncbi:hypothetical protein [Streptomyces sp. NPDC047070]|uniref:hypothetical protein n=1 Tax=Streptomyces sp. NPDC047070 TaxID=3154923 RepID=UPI0034518901